MSVKGMKATVLSLVSAGFIVFQPSDGFAEQNDQIPVVEVKGSVSQRIPLDLVGSGCLLYTSPSPRD